MQKLLGSLGACREAIRWAGNKSWEEIYKTCNNGEWLLWLYFKTTPEEDDRTFVLAKAHCANIIRHMMTKEETECVDAAIAYGNGETTFYEFSFIIKKSKDIRDQSYELLIDYYVAFAVYATCRYNADHITNTVSYVARALSVLNPSDRGAAEKKYKSTCADVVRLYIPFDKWNVTEKINLLNTKY